MLRLSMSVFILTWVAACGPSALQLEGTRWVATHLTGADLSGSTAPSTLEFTSQEHVAGHGGCTRYSGAVRIDGEALEFGDFASTKMACEAGAMEQEWRLFAAFAAARGVRREGAELLFTGDDGETLARWRPQ
jgi:heat shock protein HslJ